MATTALFLLGKSNGQRSQEGYSQWGHKEWDTTEHSAAAACTELGDVAQMSPTSGYGPVLPVTSAAALD